MGRASTHVVTPQDSFEVPERAAPGVNPMQTAHGEVRTGSGVVSPLGRHIDVPHRATSDALLLLLSA
jgi:hypothetical protein